jgi:sugar/nucleoside kinase (ribokinase family)
VARLEFVHVGSAARDVADDDPRGWRLGGGVTYAALATARLGLRTAALIGVDADAADARELDELRDAGVELRVVPVESSPVFRNIETPRGREQTALRGAAPITPEALPADWIGAAAWSLVPVASRAGPSWRSGGRDCCAGSPRVTGWSGSPRDRERCSSGPTSSRSAITTWIR